MKPIALQTHTLRDAFEADFAGTMRLLLPLAIAVIAGMALAQEPPELLVNPGFEEGETGWSAFWGREPGGGPGGSCCVSCCAGSGAHTATPRAHA